MATVNTSSFRPGLKIILDGDPCNILESEFMKPGKGQAVVRVKIRNLITGKVNEKTFRSGDSVEAADVFEKDMQYLYSDGSFWHFMDPDSYEQHAADAVAMAGAAPWIKEEDHCSVTLWNGNPLIVTPPNHVTLRVAETDPGVRGDTATGGTKPCTLETGAVVQVPLFIEQGEIIRVDTRTGDYIGRIR